MRTLVLHVLDVVIPNVSSHMTWSSDHYNPAINTWFEFEKFNHCDSPSHFFFCLASGSRQIVSDTKRWCCRSRRRVHLYGHKFSWRRQPRRDGDSPWYCAEKWWQCDSFAFIWDLLQCLRRSLVKNPWLKEMWSKATKSLCYAGLLQGSRILRLDLICLISGIVLSHFSLRYVSVLFLDYYKEGYHLKLESVAELLIPLCNCHFESSHYFVAMEIADSETILVEPYN